MAKTGIRRDSKHRVLRRGESIRWDGKYQFKYHVNGKAHFVYSWRLEPTDKLPAGKKPCLSLRELEKQIGYDLDSQMHPEGRSMTVEELVERYLSTRIGVKPNTKANYNFVKNLMKKEDFYYKKIGDVKTSDAKLFLIKLQQDGKRYSTVKTVRGVLRPAFQMAVDDDVLHKNPFGRMQMPNITPHVCRHTYCSNMAKSGMNPKTLQYLMGHSDIGVTLNTYTHLGLEDAEDELKRLEDLQNARKELERTQGEKPVSQKMFKAI